MAEMAKTKIACDFLRALLSWSEIFHYCGTVCTKISDHNSATTIYKTRQRLEHSISFRSFNIEICTRTSIYPIRLKISSQPQSGICTMRNENVYIYRFSYKPIIINDTSSWLCTCQNDSAQYLHGEKWGHDMSTVNSEYTTCTQKWWTRALFSKHFQSKKRIYIEQMIGVRRGNENEKSMSNFHLKFKARETWVF